MEKVLRGKFIYKVLRVLNSYIRKEGRCKVHNLYFRLGKLAKEEQFKSKEKQNKRNNKNWRK